MKKILILIFSVTALSSCDVTRTTVSGIENQAYLIFMAPFTQDYPDGVEVIIDKTTNFDAKVHKNISRVRNLLKYGISTGKHEIKVIKDGEILYSKSVFLSPGQTKKIVLP
jgi:hypothetical protein|tara:strand:+ start:1711 stop:2043 length:333 start_codon:yes stop_codon:yes gene_type:complete